jgi:Uma2 family endonuclease
MGHHTTQESLRLRWAELCADPRLHDLQWKIELNGRGVIEMSPANNRHARTQARLAHALEQQMADGSALTECSVLTTDGIRVPDVAWASAAFMARHGDATPFPQAPELCIEVRSPSNTDAELAHKVALFLAAGAREVWICPQEAGVGALEMFSAAGPITTSRFAVVLPADA